MLMKVNTEYLDRCIQTLERAFELLQQSEPNDFTYDIYRAASVKEFELVLEQTGSLLKKRIAGYFASNRAADRLTFKDVFRHAAKHTLITPEACERWCEYRDSRNDTAHRYGEGYAEATLELLPRFILDAKALALVIAEEWDD